ncbi:MAG TPA: tetratricopeptide repeat protein [Gemmatimonadales bacterium]|nr:tetratricopeptide repeat protein [Gemmatimonadales bacterium]
MRKMLGLTVLLLGTRVALEAQAPEQAGSVHGSTAPADTTPDLLAAGVAAWEALDPGGALALFREALAVDSLAYEPNWRAALALVTLGQETPDSVKSRHRDLLYLEAERLARRAVAADSLGADGWFMLGNAMGRAALTRPPQERLRLAREIRNAAIRAITLDRTHDGAYHLLGRWHAEIMRLPGIHRFFARRVLGARVFGEASWDEAIVNLERAVAFDSTRIVHRLDLAGIYVDRKRYDEARALLETIATMPEREYLDPRYKEEAADLLRQIEGKS